MYNFAEGQWSRGNYPCALLYQDFASAGGIQQYQPAGFSATNAVIRFQGAPTNSELVTDYFRFDPSHRALVVSVRPMCDDPNTTAGVSARVQDGDPDNFVGYGNPEPVSQQISVRADGYAHAINVKMGQSFTYCQGSGVRYALRGSR